MSKKNNKNMEPSIISNKNKSFIHNYKNGLINQTNNFIGIRFNNKDYSQDLYLLEMGHFFSFENYSDLFLEVSHSKDLKFVFKIDAHYIYYYIESGIIKYFKDQQIFEILPIEKHSFNYILSDYAKLESKSKMMQELVKASKCKL